MKQTKEKYFFLLLSIFENLDNTEKLKSIFKNTLLNLTRYQLVCARVHVPRRSLCVRGVSVSE